MTTPRTFKAMGLLSTGEVAELLRVHRTTVWHWIKNGMLRAKKVGDRFHGVSRKDLDTFRRSYIQDVAKAAEDAKKKPSKRRKAK